MSNITAYPLQDWFETTLAQSWNGAIGTVYLNTAPSFTFPSGVKTYIVVNPWKTNMQVGEIDSLHVWNKTVNVSSISVGSWAGTTYTQESHSVWSTVIISDNYQFWKNIVDAVNSKMDLSGGTFTGDVSFSWTGTEFRLPNLTTAERLALTPWNGTIVYDSTLWENYQYIAWAWNAFAAWSTQPNASETVAGKVEEATQTQLNDWTATGETGARLFTNPSKLPTAVASYVTNNAGVNAAVKAEALEVIDDEWVESIVDRDTYLLWEPAAAGDSLFVEDMVTFDSATSVQNIWDVTANTRVSIPVIWSGVAASTLKLALRKYVSPAVDLWVRIETDNAGSPSGTLLDANATATVLASALTTSLVDTTVTLAGSVTLVSWTKYWIVLFAGTYGAETINGTNYFGVGYRAIDTTTRIAKTFNGTVWSAGQATRFYYSTSSLFTAKLLSKTDATYSYKLPTDIPRIATESKSTGQNVIATTLWFNDNFSGLTPLANYYLSDIAWAISTTAGTNSYLIGKSIDENNLFVWEVESIIAWTEFTSFTANTETTTTSAQSAGVFIKVKEAVVSMDWTYTTSFEMRWNTQSSSNGWQIFKNGVALWTIQTSANNGVYETKTENLAFSKWDLIQLYARYNGSWNVQTRNFNMKYTTEKSKMKRWPAQVNID